MKSYSLDETQDLLIGKIGTLRRDEFEIKIKLIRIKNPQISRLENNK
jgi:hypothetical protein